MYRLLHLCLRRTERGWCERLVDIDDRPAGGISTSRELDENTPEDCAIIAAERVANQMKHGVVTAPGSAPAPPAARDMPQLRMVRSPGPTPAVVQLLSSQTGRRGGAGEEGQEQGLDEATISVLDAAMKEEADGDSGSKGGALSDEEQRVREEAVQMARRLVESARTAQDSESVGEGTIVDAEVGTEHEYSPAAASVAYEIGDRVARCNGGK